MTSQVFGHVEVNRQSLAGDCLARPRPVGHTAAMSGEPGTATGPRGPHARSCLTALLAVSILVAIFLSAILGLMLAIALDWIPRA